MKYKVNKVASVFGHRNMVKKYTLFFYNSYDDELGNNYEFADQESTYDWARVLSILSYCPDATLSRQWVSKSEYENRDLEFAY